MQEPSQYHYSVFISYRHRPEDERWVEYHAFAESLRSLRFLAPLGSYSAINSLENETIPERASWVPWYVRATIRELGILTGVQNADYQKQVLEIARDSEIKDQIGYHKNNATALDNLNHVLHSAGNACFVVTFIILAAFFIAFMISFIPWLLEFFGNAMAASADAHTTGNHGWLSEFLYSSKPFATVLAVAFPALGAALSSIRFTGDFENFARRSEQTAAELEVLRKEYEAVITRLENDPTGGKY